MSDEEERKTIAVLDYEIDVLFDPTRKLKRYDMSYEEWQAASKRREYFRQRHLRRKQEKTSMNRVAEHLMKVCVGCGLEKSLEEYQRKRNSIEHVDKCKACIQGHRAKKVITELKETPMQASTNGHVATKDLDDGAVVETESFEVKYMDALEVIKSQELELKRLMQLVEVLSGQADTANRRARLAEIEMQMFKLEQERAQLLDQAA